MMPHLGPLIFIDGVIETAMAMMMVLRLQWGREENKRHGTH